MDTIIERRPNSSILNSAGGLRHMASLASFLVGLTVFSHFINPGVFAGNRSDRNQQYQTSDSIQVAAGWNLMSLPVIVSDSSKNSLFPTAVSQAYVYQGRYLQKDTLQSGAGFWLKFAAPAIIQVAGEANFEDTIEVHSGWNIIGSLSLPIGVNTIHTEPEGIIVSSFYAYMPGLGYEREATLQPGFGYWVKVKESGSILLRAPGPCPGMPTVAYGGKTYHTVQIGSQCWLKENLDVGTMIPGAQDQVNNDTIEKYCYNGDTANCIMYGGLYEWNEAMQYSTVGGAQGICPSGWHIPSLAEFDTLSAAVGGDGNALKAIGQGSAAGTGTDTSGFSALLGGYRTTSGYFSYLGNSASIWSSTQYGATDGYCLVVYEVSASANLDYGGITNGVSVRCLRGYGRPNKPSNPSPPDGATGISLSMSISWTCSNPDGDSLVYNVYFGTDDPPATLVSSNLHDSSLARSGLAQGITYYWRVVAKDSHGDSTSGPVWLFATGTVPLPPLLSSPANNATNIPILPTITFTWNASTGATSYALQVSTDSSFTSYVYSQSGLTSTSRQISGLSNSTTYYWRVSATESAVTSNWSGTWNFATASSGGTPCPGTPTVTYGGKTYQTVQIGSQCWLKENLDVGTMIPGAQDQANNDTIEKYCYNGDTANCIMYGGLYEWNEAMQYSTMEGAQGICPSGWHIPSLAEFDTLSASVGGNGNALKAIGQGSVAGAGTDTSGFSALLAGARYYYGYYYYLTGIALMWSSTAYDATDDYCLYLSYGNSIIGMSDDWHYDGFSVRCIKN